MADLSRRNWPATLPLAGTDWVKISLVVKLSKNGGLVFIKG